jgi:3-oxoacyl-[acyl-carrier-protein] synthase-1
MRRVVVTGVGIVSSIGNNQDEVRSALYSGSSGITYNNEFAEFGMRSHVSGQPNIDIESRIDRRHFRFMGDAAAYIYIAMQEAIEDAGLTEKQISHYDTGIITGSGSGSPKNVVLAADNLRNHGIRRISPYTVTRTMGSSTSACLATAFKIRGTSYSISSACSTSAHCIGNAAELIQLGKQDIMFAGGAEEVHWTSSASFDAMGALSSRYNNSPHMASRPYDASRDGFVISGGGGMIVMEELEHALNRGAHIYAELVGYGTTTDGHDIVAPSGEGAVRCMQKALKNVTHQIKYINAHGTGTVMGDAKELDAIKEVFGNNIPYISSTKSSTGHALGAAGVNEAIYSLIMQKNGFIAPSINVGQLDPIAEGMPIVTERIDNINLDAVLSNSFGFGGTNVSLVFAKYG